MSECSGSTGNGATQDNALCNINDIVTVAALYIVDNIWLLFLFGGCIFLIALSYQIGFKAGFIEGAKRAREPAFIEGIKHYIKTKSYNAGDFPGSYDDPHITKAKELLAEEMRPKSPKL